MAKSKLSTRQENILKYIWEYLQKNRRPPTIREIGQSTSISSTSVVNYNLTKLVEKEMLDRDAEVSRGLRLTAKAREFLGVAEQVAQDVTGVVSQMVRVPLVGDIVASEPLEVGSEAGTSGYDEEDGLELSPSMLPSGGKTDGLFALRVNGDSMIDAMVNDGDIVVMRKQHEARNGEMVAVWLPQDGTTTLKYFHHEGERVRLQPAHPHMQPIYVAPGNVQIQGKVVMVVRQTA